MGPWLIRLIGWWCRYTVEGEEHLFEAQRRGGVILALWHGRMLIPVYHCRKRNYVSLISRSWDGEMITRIVQRLGYVTRRGSPREGGREGFMEMLRDLRSGKVVSIFPDGPTGPRHTLHNGVLQLARMSGAPIVPFTYSAIPNWRANSWDRYMIPKPFSRGLILFGEPFVVPRRIGPDQMEQHRCEIQQRLITIEQQADESVKNY